MSARQLVWVDLCSGLGGASQPALDRGWRVIRVDINPRFKPDVVADIRALPLRPFPIDVLWASPPCQEFSKHGMRCFYPNPPEPSLAIARAVGQMISELMPRFWCVENVWAARPWLVKVFGPVRAMPPGHALWSNLGFLLPNIAPHKGNLRRHPGSRGHRWFTDRGLSWCGTGDNGTSLADAAKIPYEIGEAICAVVERLSAESVLTR
jgi:hypothetical protein